MFSRNEQAEIRAALVAINDARQEIERLKREVADLRALVETKPPAKGKKNGN